jgi:type I restriction enzyme M protein
MVECVRPEPKKTIADPAAGTGGFFLAAYDYLLENYDLDKDQKEFLKYHTFKGMGDCAEYSSYGPHESFLHNIGDINSEPPIVRNDSLIAEPRDKFDYVLANPPFGKKSSITVTNEDGTQSKEALTYNRQDFWATSSNKQLNFVQHINAMLKAHGEAAVVSAG